MALLPTPRARMAVGAIGQWANMEECNSFTGFAESEFGYGVPLMLGTAAPAPDGADMNVVPLTTGNRFVGISLANINPTGTPANGEERYGVGDILGVADEGVLFVKAGGTVAKGDVPYYAPADGKYYGSSSAGRLPLPGCQFDDAAADGEPVALKIRVAPGAANVAAA